ncbi:MAG: ParB/RepB/Spo0J family partition protein [Deinococcales bacterium]
MAAKKRRPDLDRTAVFEAILGDLGEGEGEAALGTVPIEAIRYNRKQPRKYLNEESLLELTASVRDKGVLEPIIVRKAADGYELVAGERRTRAAQMAGLAEVPAIVVEIDDREALEVSIMENLQREDLNAVEETDAVITLLELNLELSRTQVLHLLQEMYNEERGRSPASAFSDRQKHVAGAMFRRLGRFTPSSFVSNRVPILDFPDTLLTAVRGGQLAFTKAQALARLEDEDGRDALLAEAIDGELSLSQIKRRITELRREQGTRPRSQVDGMLELAATSKRMLTRAHLERLGSAERERVQAILRELTDLLSG